MFGFFHHDTHMHIFLSIRYRDGTAVSFVDLNPEELAQHLTLTEQAMFFTIQPWELIAQVAQVQEIKA